MKKRFIALSALLVGVETIAIASFGVNAAEIRATESLPVAQAVQTPKAPLPAPTPAVKTPTAPMSFGLADGTPIKLKFKQTISSKTANQNDPVEFEVAEDVLIGNTIVIAKGSIARGHVAEVKRSGMLGRKGKLDIQVKEVDLASGERVSVRSSQASGGGHSGGVIALAAVINPLFLLMKGKNVTYEAGTEVGVFVDGNFALDRKKFQ